MKVNNCHRTYKSCHGKQKNVRKAEKLSGRFFKNKIFKLCCNYFPTPLSGLKKVRHLFLKLRVTPAAGTFPDQPMNICVQ